MLVGQDGVPGAAFGHICAAASLQQSTCLPIRQESMRTANGDTVLDLHERAESVPFDLKNPVRVIEGLFRNGREHRRDGGGHGPLRRTL